MPGLAGALDAARARCLAETTWLLGGLHPGSLPTAWPVVVPRLAAALGRARGAALDAADTATGAALASGLGADLGWVLVDRTGTAPRVAGRAVEQWAAGVPGSVDAAVAAGVRPGDALAGALVPALAAAGSVAHRAGRLAVVDAAAGTGGLVRWRRVAEPGACAWCRGLATRGAVYRTRATGGHAGHAHCRCHLQPATGAAEVARTVAEGAEEWQRVLDETPDPFAGARARRAAANVAAGRARLPRVDPRLTAPGAATPERLASVRTQIGVYSRAVPGMQARLAGGDATAARPLAWQRQRLAELRAEEARLAAQVRPQRASRGGPPTA